MTPYFTPDPHQLRWAKRRAQRYGGGVTRFLEIVSEQKGKCALSGVPLLFDSAHGTAIPGRGVHARYAALDHVSPACESQGFQIVCYALNDLKGHLPYDCFQALKSTGAWESLMTRWNAVHAKQPMDSKAFYSLLKTQG
ncbi:hypothetical protein [Luteolibacter soli]|uniref:Uncharacterized protein n=1 Tax=Luteolibacter soli TaxID=3135280 RepID=A0ABU9AUK5_9BACT